MTQSTFHIVSGLSGLVIEDKVRVVAQIDVQGNQIDVHKNRGTLQLHVVMALIQCCKTPT
jgi:hypothetical protein